MRLKRVDLEFTGFGKRMHELQRVYGGFLEPNMRIEKASGSEAIRVVVGDVNPNLVFKPQAEKVSEAIGAAQALLEWFRLQVQLGCRFSLMRRLWYFHSAFIVNV